MNLTMLDVDKVVSQIDEAADPNAIIILGTSIKEEMQDEIAVTVIAAGFDGREPGQAVEKPLEEVLPSTPLGGETKPEPTQPFGNTLEMDIPDFLKK